MSVASEFDHAEQVVADVAILQDMAEGRLDDERVKQAAQVLLEHRRDELPSVSVAVAARLLGVSRTIIESWRDAGVLTSVPVRRRRYQITIESIVRVQALLEELRRLMPSRQLGQRVSRLFMGLSHFLGQYVLNVSTKSMICARGRNSAAIQTWFRSSETGRRGQARAVAGCQARWQAVRRAGWLPACCASRQVLGQVRDDDHPLVVGGQRPPVLAVAGRRGEAGGQQPVP